MVIGIIIMTLIVIKIKNGNLSSIYNFKISDLKGYKIIILAAGLLFVTDILIKTVLFDKALLYFELYKYIHILSLFSVALILAFNYKNPGYEIMSIGFFMNLIPIVLNGRMPVKYSALEKTLVNNTNSLVINHAKILEMDASFTHGIFVNPKVEFLSDIIPIVYPRFMAKVISIGDIVITVGIVIAMLYISKEK